MTQCTYSLRIDGEVVGDDYPTIEAAREAALEEGDASKWETSTETTWTDVQIIEAEDGYEDVVVDTVVVTTDPEEPDCTDDEDHDWQSPVDIVGGCEENPGVFGSGGGVHIHEVCLHCGCERIIDTWAQRRDTGEQGLRSVEYIEGKYADEVEAIKEDKD